MRRIVGMLVMAAAVFISVPAVAQDKAERQDGDKTQGAVARVDVSKLVPPRRKKVTAPVYPPEGFSDTPVTVVFKLTVGEKGLVTNVEVVRSGGAPYDREAVRAVRQWEFEPARYEGKPITTKIEVPILFPARPRPKNAGHQKPTGNAPVDSGASVTTDGTAAAAGSTTDGTKAPDGTQMASSDATPASPVNRDIQPRPTYSATVTGQGTSLADSAAARSATDASDGDIVTTGVETEEEVQTTAATPAGGREIVVRGRRVVVKVKAGRFRLTRKVLAIAPHSSGGDMLKTAPGFYVGHPQAGGMANALFLRGFNAEHGQDIEIWVGEAPVNLPGHIHAQGYADMRFIIPEVVRSIDVVEGVFSPSQGDFAVAGSVHYRYGVRRRGLHAGFGYGSFGTRRLLAIWAPRGQSFDTFVASEFRTTEGFGENRSSKSASVMGRYRFPFGDRGYGVVHVGAFGSRAALPGVLRLDDIESGRVDFYGSYADPTAQAQSSFFTRMEMSALLHRQLLKKGESVDVSMFVVRTDFRVRQNFTGYVLYFPDQPELVGAGDLHSQYNLDTALGGRVEYRTGARKVAGMEALFTMGMQVRSDFIDQSEDLLYPAQNLIWRHMVDASMELLDLGTYLDSRWTILEGLVAHAGVRADSLFFEVNDRLGNQLYDITITNYELGYRRDAQGTFIGPRFSLSIGPVEKSFFKERIPKSLRPYLWPMSVSVAYGEGFRSPQPRMLQEGEKAPFATVRSVEATVKWSSHIGALTAGTYYTHLSEDYVFDPTWATVKPIGPTTRMGWVLQGLLTKGGFVLSGSLTYVKAVLDSPPPATPDNPTPGEKAGDLLPYVPPYVGRVDAGYSRKWRGWEGQVGLGYTWLAPRPLPYSQFADPVHLVDASASVTRGDVRVRLDVRNLLDTRWHDMEYNFVSQWDPSSHTPLPQRHIVAGAPRTVMLSLNIWY